MCTQSDLSVIVVGVFQEPDAALVILEHALLQQEFELMPGDGTTVLLNDSMVDVSRQPKPFMLALRGLILTDDDADRIIVVDQMEGFRVSPKGNGMVFAGITASMQGVSRVKILLREEKPVILGGDSVGGSNVPEFFQDTLRDALAQGERTSGIIDAFKYVHRPSNSLAFPIASPCRLQDIVQAVQFPVCVGKIEIDSRFNQ